MTQTNSPWLGQVPISGNALGQIPANPSTWRYLDLRAWLDKVTTQLEVRPDCGEILPANLLAPLLAKANSVSMMFVQAYFAANLSASELEVVSVFDECLSMDPGAFRLIFVQPGGGIQEDGRPGADGEIPEEGILGGEGTSPALLALGGLGVGGLLIAIFG